MRPEDLKTVAQLGRALWANPGQADPQTAETLSAVSLMPLTDDRAVEKAAQALLDRATRAGMAANTWSNLSRGDLSQNAFFRLFPEERFLLVALHSGRWSYARVARILGYTLQEVEETVWGIRLKLSRLTPLGSGLATPHCPEYDLRRPWTQRFLDDEIPNGRERLFLQNHLMACMSCSRALSRCRDIYYGVDAVIPRLRDQGSDVDFVKSLGELMRDSSELKSNTTGNVRRSFVQLLGRFDVRLALFVLIAAIYILARKSLLEG